MLCFMRVPLLFMVIVPAITAGLEGRAPGKRLCWSWKFIWLIGDSAFQGADLPSESQRCSSL